MYCKLTMIGRVGKDPEIRMANGKKVASFTLATSKKYKDQSGQYTEKTAWHNCVAFVGAEFIEKYVTKGSMLHVEGEIRYDKWTDKNGVEKYKTEILVSNSLLLDKKGTAEKTSITEEETMDEDDLDNSIPF